MAKTEKAAPKAAPKAAAKSTPRGRDKTNLPIAEECFGCGAVSTPENPHPVIGVVHEQDAKKAATLVDHPTGEAAEDGQNYVGVPVCHACWTDPQHRTKNALKVHFFERKGNAAQIGLLLAGSFNVQG